MNQKLKFLCFPGIHNLGYSRIKIDHIADSLLKLQIRIVVHLINVQLSSLLTLKRANTIRKLERMFIGNNFCENFDKRPCERDIDCQ